MQLSVSCVGAPRQVPRREKPMLPHPGDELVGVVSLLKSVFGKDRLITPVVTKRIAQAQRLRKFTRLVDQLMNPLQIVRTLCAGQNLKNRPLPKL